MSLLRVEGRLRVFAIPEARLSADGSPLDYAQLASARAELVMDNHNLIVANGLQWVAKKLGHALGTPPITVGGQTVSSLNDLQISKMKVGNASAPAAPASGDTALADPTPLVTLSTITVSYPSASSVRFRATIAPNTVTGQGLTEAGIFCTIASTDVLIGRLLFSPVTVVVAATGYQLDYDISLSAS